MAPAFITLIDPAHLSIQYEHAHVDTHNAAIFVIHSHYYHQIHAL